jgi:hypothetical protein
MARHKFFVDVGLADGGVMSHELTPGNEGERVGKLTAPESGSMEVTARIEPGTKGSLSRRAPPRTLTVVPPLDTVFDSPYSIGMLKAGEPVERELDLSSINVPGEELLFKVSPNGMPLDIQPSQVSLTKENKKVKLTLTAWKDADLGELRGKLAFEPLSEPYTTAEAIRVPVVGSINSGGMLGGHAGKILVLLVVLAGAAVAVVLRGRNGKTAPKVDE